MLLHIHTDSVTQAQDTYPHYYPAWPIVPDLLNPKQKTLVLICFQQKKKKQAETIIKCAERPKDARDSCVQPSQAVFDL